MSRAAALWLGACLVALAGAGCGSDRPDRGEGTVEVAATTAPVADLVRSAGGRRVRVTTLVPRGADPHDWRPDERAIAAARSADLLVRGGGDVEPWAEQLEAGRSLELLPRLDPIGEDGHWWHDPVRVQRAVKEIRNELARVDVHGAGYYEAATADYLEALRELDAESRRCIASVWEPGARLVAQHDGFAYFGDRYGVEVVGPGEPRARLGRRLWADTLAAEGEPADDYLDAFEANVATIVDALSGGERSCRPSV